PDRARGTRAAQDDGLDRDRVLRYGRTLIALALAATLLALMAAPAQARPRRVPVVVIVFDEFPTTGLIGWQGRIDRVRYPNFAALAGDATWFPHATTVADATSA